MTNGALLLSCALMVPACAGMGGESDGEPPSLEVASPSRAAQLDGADVTVSGRASDGGTGVASVVVNGVAAEVAADGAFAVELALDGGVTLLEVVARDGAGNEARDVRAVLSGRRSAESVVAGGLMARIGPGAYGLAAAAVRAAVVATDVGAEAAAPGALFGVPGCFEVHLVGFEHGAVDVDLQPRAGGVGVELELRDVVLDLRVDVGGFCDDEGTSAPARLTADALRLRGLARLVVSEAGVRPDLGGVAADFEGVELDTDLVPGEVVDLLVSAAPSELASALGGAVRGLAGGALGSALGELDAVEWESAIQGLGLSVRLAPTAVEAGVDGVAVTSSVELAFDALGPVEYVAGAGPAEAPELDGDSTLRLAVADDVANLTLAALWAGGFLERSVAIPADHAARTRLGLDRLDLALALPPMVRSGAGSARIVIGDAVVTAYDLEGAAVMRLAVSAVADLALSGAGGAHLTLIPDEAQLWASPLQDDGGSSATLELPEPLRLAALDEMTRFLGESLAALPVPELTGVARVSTLAAVPGYVVLGADLAVP